MRRLPAIRGLLSLALVSLLLITGCGGATPAATPDTPAQAPLAPQPSTAGAGWSPG